MSHSHTCVHKNVTPYQPGRGIKIKEKVKSALETAVGASQAGCCPRCADQVQWKQKYGKFKMLKQPTNNGCLKLLVKAAYHKLCRDAAAVAALTEAMAGMRERERRAARRALEQGLPLPPHLPRRQDGSDDDDEEEEAEEEEEEEEEEGEEGNGEGGEGREEREAAAGDDVSEAEEEDES